jgi:hypothetical protein
VIGVQEEHQKLKCGGEFDKKTGTYTVGFFPKKEQIPKKAINTP